VPLKLADERPPIPPADLILRVALSFGADQIDSAREAFDLEAHEHLLHFERALACAGRTFSDFNRLLDFGCGCGRFIRHLVPLSDEVEIHGTDIDAEMIDWLRANVAEGFYEVAPHQPPLPYPDHHFDLVINHSVFSHLDEARQDLWLAELQRITAPGALLLLTVEGQSSWNRTAGFSERAGDPVEAWRAELESRGILFISADAFAGSTHPDFYHSTVHAPWYVFEHWTHFFDLVAYIPDGSVSQDLVVLRRRADGAAQPRPIVRRASAAPPAPPAPASAVGRSARASIRAAAAEVRELVRRQPAEPSVEVAALRRETNMLRASLYEQSQRISVIAAQLREEILSERERAEPPAGC
jgi:SAM-dependent methyltransferase